MKILIPAIIALGYLLIGYIIAMILVVLDDNPWGVMRYDNHPDTVMVAMITFLWPILIPMLAIWLLWKLIRFIGNKVAVIPISIALGIKYVLERNIEDDND